MTEARPIGAIAALPRPETAATSVTASPALSIAELLKLNTANVPERLTDPMLAKLERLANISLPPLTPIGGADFAKCMRLLQASLPRRASEDVAGELMVAAYQRMLGHMPREQVEFLTARALATCKWFPAIAECIDLAKGWTRPEADKRAWCRARASRERQQRLDDMRGALRRGEVAQADIDVLPRRLCEILEAESWLRVNEDGSYRLLPFEGASAA